MLVKECLNRRCHQRGLRSSTSLRHNYLRQYRCAGSKVGVATIRRGDAVRTWSCGRRGRGTGNATAERARAYGGISILECHVACRFRRIHRGCKGYRLPGHRRINARGQRRAAACTRYCLRRQRAGAARKVAVPAVDRGNAMWAQCQGRSGERCRSIVHSYRCAQIRSSIFELQGAGERSKLSR